MRTLAVLLKFVWRSNNEIEDHEGVLFVDNDDKLRDFSGQIWSVAMGKICVKRMKVICF